VWPVPDDWYDHPSRWGCDAVSFRVADYERWRDDHGHGGHEVFRDRFEMRRCGDDLYRNVYFDGGSLTINIECTESRHGDPTEIVGRIIWDGGSSSRTLFRIDVDGRHGDRPGHGRIYAGHVGPLRVEIKVDDFDIDRAGRRWAPARIDWIRFDVRALVERRR
jgi:hypothetical protein